MKPVKLEETFVEGWEYLEDHEMGHDHNVFTPLPKPSIISFSTTITGFNEINLELMTNEIVRHLDEHGHEYITSARSQFGHTKNLQMRKCFRSCVMFEIHHEGRRYNARCFPKTGETTTTGVTEEDFSDGRIVIEILMNFLQALLSLQLVKVTEHVVLINHNFRILRPCPRSVINAKGIYEVLKNNELFSFTKGNIADNMSTFKIMIDGRFCVSIKIHLEGKVAISSKNLDHARYAYQLLKDIFNVNWDRCMAMSPRTYTDLKIQAEHLRYPTQKYYKNWFIKTLGQLRDSLKIKGINNA